MDSSVGSTHASSTGTSTANLAAHAAHITPAKMEYPATVNTGKTASGTNLSRVGTGNESGADDKEKKGLPLEDYDIESGSSGSRRKLILGGRVEPPLKRRGQGDGESEGDDSSAEFSVEKQIESEEGKAIKYRSCSWHKVSRLCRCTYKGKGVILGGERWRGKRIAKGDANAWCRLRLCSFRSIFVWLLCRSRGRTRSLDWCRA